MTDLDLLSGRELGEFVLRERIGAGGYGTVYRCEQPALGRAAVVKVLRPRRHNETAPERFVREAQLASRLDHPYAAHVYSFGIEDDGLRWIAMELVQGLTLAEWLKSRGPMPLARFVPFFEHVTLVVQAAHARGIVHRDLKPSNIMVLESEGQLFPKLLDFGVAKLLEDPEPPDDGPDDGARDPANAIATVRIRAAPPPERTNSDPGRGSARLTPRGAVVGSVPYMSPEQWDDPSNVGPATDIYSLGCVAYQALSGRTPFTAESPGAYYELHCRAEPPPLGDRFPPGVDQALRRALAKSPDARQANALELATELRAVLRAQPREQLRVSAQQWYDRGRPAALLWGDDLLAALEQWMQRSVRTGPLTKLELEFVDASRDRAAAEVEARRRRKARLHLATLALVFAGAAAGLGALQWRAVERARDAQSVSEAKQTAANVEQGRAALLHGEMDEARQHLGEAWQRGERSSGMAFMLARALQPRLAELATFSSISGRMWSAAFSPDGQQIVTTDDGGAQVWDVHSHQRLLSLPGDRVYSAVYGADGTQLITTAWDGVRIWNAATGLLVRELRNSATPTHYFLAAAASDGRLVAALDTTGTATDVWDAATGSVLTEIHNDAAAPRMLAFSMDGHWLATSSGDHIRIVDTTTWHPVSIPVRHVLGLSFEPGGSRIATATADGGAAIWMLPGGSLVRRLRESGEPIDQIAWSPDGHRIATASRDGAEQVWDARSGALVSQSNYLHARPSSIEFDPAGQLLLIAGARVVVSDAEQAIAIAAFDSPQRMVRFAPREDGQLVVGVSLEGMAHIWDARSSYRRWTSPPVADSCGMFGGVEPDRRIVAVGCPGHATRVWDMARDQLLAELPSVSTPDGDFAPVFPAVSSDGTRAALARGTTVDLYELPGGRTVRTIAHGAAVTAVAFGAGHDLLSGDAAGAVLVTRGDSPPLSLPPARGGIDAVTSLANGNVVVTDAARQLRIFDSARALVLELETPERVALLRPSPDARHLVTVPSSAIPGQYSSIGPAQLWDLEAGRFITRLAGHLGRTFSARWISNDQILTAGGDGTARWWDGITGRERKVYRGGARFLSDATLGPGDLIVAGDGDGVLHFWDAPSGERLWTLKAHTSHVAALHFEGGDLVTRGFGGEVSRWSLPEASKVIEEARGRGIVAP